MEIPTEEGDWRGRFLHRALLYDQPTSDPQELRRRGVTVARKLRQLPAHGLLKEVPRTHR